MKEVIDLLEKAANLLGMVSANSFKDNICENCGIAEGPLDCIRKALSKLQAPPRYETPEQYKKRTGIKVKENDAVYHRHAMKNWHPRTMQTHPYFWGPWFVKSYGAASEYEFQEGHAQLVVATEAGCPPDNWMPEEDAGCAPNKWLPEDEVSELS